MTKNEALGKATRIISLAVTKMGGSYWLCVHNKQLCYYPKTEVPKRCKRVFAFTDTMSNEGMRGREWDLLNLNLCLLIDGGEL